MLKKLIAIFVSFIFFSLNFTNLYAEENVDMSEWKYVQVESDGVHNISLYYSNNDFNKRAFCIEPGVSFNKKQSYSKAICDDETIFDLVKAYELYGKSIDDSTSTFNYYIATQILIWEHLTEQTYSFTKDYSTYKQEINDYVTNMNMPLLMAANNQNVYESSVGEEVTIEENYSEYNVEADSGVEIIENTQSGLTYKVTESEPEYKSIGLSPIYNPKDYAYKYTSENSQDIYCFEGTYDVPTTFSLLLYTPPQYVNIYYSKKDTNGNPIEGAKFTVYELNNENPDTERVFIHKGTDIDIYQAILGDYTSYTNLRIELSERYESYLTGNIINTSEIGYFPYKIYEDATLIKEGVCYVSDDTNQTSGAYARYDVLSVFEGYSEAIETNTISSLDYGKQYYICESEPAKGYVYTHNACKLVDTSTYNGEVLEYVNSTRTYTLKLMKQSPYEVLLDGAIFKITYLDGDETKDIILTTGYLNINRENNYEYLIYKHENEDDIKVVRFEGDTYSTNDVNTGKYYYYQSSDPTIDQSKLNDKYTLVLKGGITIENMPYSSSLTIEELEAPKGFMITEPIYQISPNIAYSEITFRNFRVNEFEILPKKKFKIPKTCIENYLY